MKQVLQVASISIEISGERVCAEAREEYKWRFEVAGKLWGGGHGYAEVLLRLSGDLTKKPHLPVKLNKYIL